MTSAVPIESVLQRLAGHNLRESGRDRWRACCPAHGGSNPSALSVGIGDDGRVLLRCWHGCTVEQIAQGLGLDVGDLFPPRPVRAGNGTSPLKRRRMLSASQALDLLEREALVIAVTAHDVHERRVITEHAWQRLRTAAARVGELAEEVRA